MERAVAVSFQGCKFKVVLSPTFYYVLERLGVNPAEAVRYAFEPVAWDSGEVGDQVKQMLCKTLAEILAESLRGFVEKIDVEA